MNTTTTTESQSVAARALEASSQPLAAERAAAGAVLTRFFAEVGARRMSDAQAAEALGMSATTVSRVRRGIYEGDLSAVAERAALALRLWAERAACQGVPFIQTTVAKKVFAACDFALTRQTPVILTGLSQMGKTTAIERYAAESDAVVRVVRMPAATSFQEFCDALADALMLPRQKNLTERRRKIMGSLNARTLLIIDELHELVVSATRRQTRRVVEYLRECYDRSRCGLLLCGTDAVETDLLSGPDAGLLDQIVQRAINVRLPRTIPLEDVQAVAASVGLPTAIPEAVRRELRTLRMNRLTLLCAMAAEAARRHNRPLDWELFLKTKVALLGE